MKNCTKQPCGRSCISLAYTCRTPVSDGLPNCTKQRCGRSCIAWAYTCRTPPYQPTGNPIIDDFFANQPAQPQPDPQPSNPNPTETNIWVNVSVNIIQGMAYKRHPPALSYMTCDDIETTVFDHVNKLWSQAGISFAVKTCRVVPAILPSDENEVWGVKNCEKLFNRCKLEDFRAINLYIVPIINGVTTGYTAYTTDTGRKLFILMAEHTTFQRRTLHQFASTLAHEIGHYLNLGHVDDETNIMYAYSSDEKDKLSKDQIKQARTAAEQLFTETRSFAAPLCDPADPNISRIE